MNYIASVLDQKCNRLNIGDLIKNSKQQSTILIATKIVAAALIFILATAKSDFIEAKQLPHTEMRSANNSQCSNSSIEKSLSFNSDLDPRNYEIYTALLLGKYNANGITLRTSIIPEGEMNGTCPYKIILQKQTCPLDRVIFAIRTAKRSNKGESSNIYPIPGVIDCMGVWSRHEAMGLNDSGSKSLINYIDDIFSNKNVCDNLDVNIHNLTSINDRIKMEGLSDLQIPEADYIAGMLANACGDHAAAIKYIMRSASLHFNPAMLEMDFLLRSPGNGDGK